MHRYFGRSRKPRPGDVGKSLQQLAVLWQKPRDPPNDDARGEGGRRGEAKDTERTNSTPAADPTATGDTWPFTDRRDDCEREP